MRETGLDWTTKTDWLTDYCCSNVEDRAAREEEYSYCTMYVRR